MLKAELEIRDEPVDLSGVQLEMSREEVRKLRLILGGRFERVCSIGGRDRANNLGWRSGKECSDVQLDVEHGKVPPGRSDGTVLAAGRSRSPGGSCGSAYKSTR
jgi:hypothetical protein